MPSRGRRSLGRLLPAAQEHPRPRRWWSTRTPSTSSSRTTPPRCPDRPRRRRAGRDRTRDPREPREGHLAPMRTEDTAWLRVRGLSKQFGGARALTGVDLDVHRGEVHGLVEANGAGKSTLDPLPGRRHRAGPGRDRRGRLGGRRDDAAGRRARRAGVHPPGAQPGAALQLAGEHPARRAEGEAGRVHRLEGVQPDGVRGGRADRVEFSLDRRVDELSVAEQVATIAS